MAFGFAERRDIERVVKSVLVTERLSQNDRTRLGSGGFTAPACAYIAQSSTAGIAASTGSTPTSGTVKFFQISTGGTLSQISTGETVYNFTRERVPASKYFLAVREYGSHNYCSVPGSGGYDRVKGATTTALSSTSSTFSIDGVVATKGQSPVTGSTSTLTVSNDFAWSADNDATVYAEYHDDDGLWHAYQVTCPA